MTWTRLSDDWADREDLLMVSRSARLLDVEAKVWCNKRLRDGALPRHMLNRITDSDNPAADADELVAAGVWTQTDDGWQLDWTDQESAERVKERREFNANRQRAFRERGERHSRGDHSLCTEKCPHRDVSGGGSRNALGNGARNATVTSPPPLPLPSPSRPKDKGQGERAGRTADAAPARSEGDETTRPAGHEWRDDGSGVSCSVCGLPSSNSVHGPRQAEP